MTLMTTYDYELSYFLLTLITLAFCCTYLYAFISGQAVFDHVYTEFIGIG